jgi:hypothetical protein
LSGCSGWCGRVAVWRQRNTQQGGWMEGGQGVACAAQCEETVTWRAGRGNWAGDDSRVQMPGVSSELEEQGAVKE